MKTYQLIRSQIIPDNIDTVWKFFSTPHNLAKITPPDMGFTILNTIQEGPIQEGMEIDYIVRPILHLPLHWKTRISHVIENECFTDVQLEGPYQLWEHTHRFIPQRGGVRMIDKITYALPLGPLGELAHGLFVKKRLEYIFDYRNIQINQLFSRP